MLAQQPDRPRFLQRLPDTDSMNIEDLIQMGDGLSVDRDVGQKKCCGQVAQVAEIVGLG